MPAMIAVALAARMLGGHFLCIARQRIVSGSPFVPRYCCRGVKAKLVGHRALHHTPGIISYLERRLNNRLRAAFFWHLRSCSRHSPAGRCATRHGDAEASKRILVSPRICFSLFVVAANVIVTSDSATMWTSRSVSHPSPSQAVQNLQYSCCGAARSWTCLSKLVCTVSTQCIPDQGSQVAADSLSVYFMACWNDPRMAWLAADRVCLLVTMLYSLFFRLYPRVGLISSRLQPSTTFASM